MSQRSTGKPAATPLVPLLLKEPTLTNVNEDKVRSFLRAEAIAPALHNAFVESLQSFPVRFMVIDDSGSMTDCDGHLPVQRANGTWEVTNCERWTELGSSCRFMVNLLRVADTPCEIRLLNGPPTVMRIGMGAPRAVEDRSIGELMAKFDQAPRGMTPLCWHVKKIVDEIATIEDDLRTRGQKALVVIATDGEPSDGQLERAMRPLEHLPVHVIVRLCTDNDQVVNFWKQVDDAVELEMDLLDDFVGEAREVESFNPWLTYNHQLHLLRTLGHPLKEFDFLNEKPLSPHELRTIMPKLVGEAVPDPLANWRTFSQSVAAIAAEQPRIFSPTTMTTRPLINVEMLDRAYSALSGAEPLPPPPTARTTAAGPSNFGIVHIAIALLLLLLVLKWLIGSDFFASSTRR